jgi:hypothetical protein
MTFFFPPKRPDRFWESIQLHVQWVTAVFHSEMKQHEREVHHSSPSSDKVKNKWSHTSTHPHDFINAQEQFTFILKFVLFLNKY